MKKSLEYITVILGLLVVIKKIYDVATKALPLFVTDNFTLYKTQILGVDIALLEPKGDSNPTPEQLKRVMEIAEQKLNMRVVFVFDSLKAYNRQRLINRMVNFIVLDKQVFIPSLMIDLKPEPKTEQKSITKLTTLAQQIILYHLQVKTINGFTVKEVSKMFNATYITTNRAINGLDQLSIIDLTDEKERKIEFKLKGRELWDKVEPLMNTPVSKVLYTDEVIEGATSAHINALAHYTMINEDANHQYAIYKKEFKELRIIADKEFGDNRIEVWKYPPTQITNSKYVDKLSLYLSLRKKNDERIQIELESLINEMKWLEE